MELRANQVLATFKLVCDRLRGDEKPWFDPDSDENATLVKLQQDVAGDTYNNVQGNMFVSMADLQTAYAPKLPHLRDAYGKETVDAVVNEFEMD